MHVYFQMLCKDPTSSIKTLHQAFNIIIGYAKYEHKSVIRVVEVQLTLILHVFFNSIVVGFLLSLETKQKLRVQSPKVD